MRDVTLELNGASAVATSLLTVERRAVLTYVVEVAALAAPIGIDVLDVRPMECTVGSYALTIRECVAIFVGSIKHHGGPPA